MKNHLIKKLEFYFFQIAVTFSDGRKNNPVL